MIQLGERQKLVVVKTVDFGVYVAPAAGEAEEKVLLPKKQVPEGTKIGDELEVFIYRDSNDRLIATTNEAKLSLGEVALLKVSQVAAIGAFLDWGLEKDLFLPFREQTKQLKEGDECLVALYIDKSDRLCATMKVYTYLSTESGYKKDDRIEGHVYEISKNFGAFVAVDDKYSGLIPMKEIREKSYLQIGKDVIRILDILEKYDGVLPFNDKASPETIRREMQMSKNEFKRAVGHLLKEGKITITEKNIRLN